MEFPKQQLVSLSSIRPLSTIHRIRFAFSRFLTLKSRAQFISSFRPLLEAPIAHPHRLVPTAIRNRPSRLGTRVADTLPAVPAVVDVELVLGEALGADGAELALLVGLPVLGPGQRLDEVLRPPDQRGHGGERP